LINPAFLDEFRRDQKEHVRDLSRLVVVGYGNTTTADCPNCTFDYVSNSSGATYTAFTGTVTLFSGTGYERTFEAKSFKQVCPVCGGKGFFAIPNEESILMHVYWYDGEKFGTFPSAPLGRSRQRQVKLKTDSVYYDKLMTAKYFKVDGIEVEPSSDTIIRSVGTTDGIAEVWCTTKGAVGP
jgi:hypothetical protein